MRQVYKTQLKNETIVEVDQDDREVSARLFRGVEGDGSRRGELFGIANLLRFKDGTFMQYGCQTRDEARFGENIYSVGHLLSNAQADEMALQRAVEDDDSASDLLALAGNGQEKEHNGEEYQQQQQAEGNDEGVQDLVGLTERGKPKLHRVVLRSFSMTDSPSFALYSLSRSTSCTRRNAGCRKPEHV